MHAVHAAMSPTALLYLPAMQFMQVAVLDVRYWPAEHCALTVGRSHSRQHRAGNDRRQARVFASTRGIISHKLTVNASTQQSIDFICSMLVFI